MKFLTVFVLCILHLFVLRTVHACLIVDTYYVCSDTRMINCVCDPPQYNPYGNGPYCVRWEYMNSDPVYCTNPSMPNKIRITDYSCSRGEGTVCGGGGDDDGITQPPANVTVNPDKILNRTDPDRFDIGFYGIPTSEVCNPWGCSDEGEVWLNSATGAIGSPGGADNGDWGRVNGISGNQGVCLDAPNRGCSASNGRVTFNYDYTYTKQNNGLFKYIACGRRDHVWSYFSNYQTWKCGDWRAPILYPVKSSYLPGEQVGFQFFSNMDYEYFSIHDTTGESASNIINRPGKDATDLGFLNNCSSSFSDKDADGYRAYTFVCTLPNTTGDKQATFSNRQNCESVINYKIANLPIAGKVINSKTNQGMENIQILVFNGATTKTTTTDANGNYSLPTDGFISNGQAYDVWVYGNQPHIKTAPDDFGYPAKPTTYTYSWNHTDSRDIVASDLYYKTQKLGINDCAGPQGAGGAKGRCNFSYTPLPDICSNPMPGCLVGTQILQNPTFDTNSSSWTFTSSPAPNNGTGRWSRGALRTESTGSAQAGWLQEVNAGAASGYLPGDRIRISANLFRTVNQDTGGWGNPYIGINLKSGGTWTNNYGGTTSLTTVNTCSTISKDIVLPNNTQAIRAFVYNWNAKAGVNYADWVSVCKMPVCNQYCTQSTDCPSTAGSPAVCKGGFCRNQTCENSTTVGTDGTCSCPAPTFRCTGTLPSNGTLCSNDDQGLLVDTSLVEVTNCTAGRKCEYTLASSGGAACEITVGYPGATECQGLKVNSAGLIFGLDTVSCP